MGVVKGVLEVTAVGAKGLKKKQTIGVQDPYLILKLGSGQAKTRTHVDGGSDPVWNQTLRLNCASEATLFAEIKNENLVADTFLGRVEVPLAAVYKRGGLEGSYPILSHTGKQRGFLTLSLAFHPAEPTSTSFRGPPAVQDKIANYQPPAGLAKRTDSQAVGATPSDITYPGPYLAQAPLRTTSASSSFYPAVASRHDAAYSRSMSNPLSYPPGPGMATAGNGQYGTSGTPDPSSQVKAGDPPAGQLGANSGPQYSQWGTGGVQYGQPGNSTPQNNQSYGGSWQAQGGQASQGIGLWNQSGYPAGGQVATSGGPAGQPGSAYPPHPSHVGKDAQAQPGGTHPAPYGPPPGGAIAPKTGASATGPPEGGQMKHVQMAPGSPGGPQPANLWGPPAGDTWHVPPDNHGPGQPIQTTLTNQLASSAPGGPTNEKLPGGVPGTGGPQGYGGLNVNFPREYSEGSPYKPHVPPAPDSFDPFDSNPSNAPSKPLPPQQLPAGASQWPPPPPGATGLEPFFSQLSTGAGSVQPPAGKENLSGFPIVVQPRTGGISSGGDVETPKTSPQQYPGQVPSGYPTQGVSGVGSAGGGYPDPGVSGGGATGGGYSGQGGIGGGPTGGGYPSPGSSGGGYPGQGGTAGGPSPSSGAAMPGHHVPNLAYPNPADQYQATSKASHGGNDSWQQQGGVAADWNGQAWLGGRGNQGGGGHAPPGGVGGYAPPGGNGGYYQPPPQYSTDPSTQLTPPPYGAQSYSPSSYPPAPDPGTLKAKSPAKPKKKLENPVDNPYPPCDPAPPQPPARASSFNSNPPYADPNYGQPPTNPSADPYAAQPYTSTLYPPASQGYPPQSQPPPGGAQYGGSSGAGWPPPPHVYQAGGGQYSPADWNQSAPLNDPYGAPSYGGGYPPSNQTNPYPGGPPPAASTGPYGHWEAMFAGSGGAGPPASSSNPYPEYR